MTNLKVTSSGIIIFLIIFGIGFFFPSTTVGSQFNPDPDLIWSVPEEGVELWSMAVSSIENKIAVGFTVNINGTYRDEIKILNATTGNEFITITNFTSSPLAMSWSPDGRFLASTGYYNNHIYYNF
ncbi:MAG: hypothetical protein QF682_00485 [Candidatus Thermoplasmatota archaeon]|jgi:hypothetical protein|nr:hypothetical protein [Candidatus Thermoplasmatota archaeon]